MMVRQVERYPSWYEGDAGLSSKVAGILARRRGQVSG